MNAAHKYFDLGFEIIKRLAEQDPSNRAWQYELAIAYYDLGGIHLSLGEFKEARKFIEKCRLIHQRNIDHDPSNIVWQRQFKASNRLLNEIPRT